ncbi:phosphate ABC transporter permease subunit PstC [Synoicihabitans lomoniglobus]|uniref:Phosphate transport system permease protein n=1 Tax=Synoicihabitans lomoniglobus TaxID=2909285 RepID=A0AAF0CQD0_9BACT|nr:phosphate ABC transporter permease subunit PstC [Opitutaceae bacterium LMO-M01]WED66114.1 phosphate ABC transporter permease subunit PstC [Opitutaceae bacterium LMO-M01]
MESSSRPPFAITKTKTRFLGLTLDECVQAFFGGNALVAVIVLGLITIFLFREGSGFFTQNRANLELYRTAGLEYVDHLRQQEEDHTALTRYLFDLRVRAFQHYTDEEGVDLAEANQRLMAFDDYSYDFGDTVEPLRGAVLDLSDVATAIKTKALINEDRIEERRQLLAEGKDAEAAAVQITDIDFDAELQPLLAFRPHYGEINAAFSASLDEVLEQQPPALPTPVLQKRFARFRELVREYQATFPAIETALDAWDHTKPVSFAKAFSSFVTGSRWLTASFWQDWYGVVPLFVGSLMVSIVALVIAVPLGVGAAIYVNQLASPREQRFIKPCIEFISAIPSVVLGFFGIAVLGQAIRLLSEWQALSWVPGFPVAERLNALTAGVLLALIAVPTIFTLAEDALQNVPRAFKEASFALGATRLQTILRIIMPAALSGIVSAMLLGFGRVIGETMVVLLCAGNRIAIPDFTTGFAAFTQPVHTMTGIIAQEMGEVVQGGIHYRALFVVGMLLFFIALLINFLAQKIVHRYRISIG